MRRELALILLAGCLFFAAALTDAYDTERRPANEDEAGSSSSAAPPAVETRQERLGYAVLVNAGYVDVTMPADEQRTAGNFLITPQFDNPETLCAAPPLSAPDAATGDAAPPDAAPAGADRKVDAQFLLMSILAAEKYNRSAAMRWIEGIWARTVFEVTGEVPDLSLGIAQIRPSTIRHALAQNATAILPNADELLDYALDDCSNVFAASMHLQSLLRSVDDAMAADEIVATVARLYVGGDNAMYIGAVVGAYRILAGGGELPEDSGQAADLQAQDFDICVWFEPGTPDGEIAWDDYSDAAQPVIRSILAKTSEIRIVMIDRQPGPRSYLLRLDNQRRQWLGKTLAALGTNPRAILFEASQDIDLGCFGADAPAASARLRVALPAGFQAPAKAQAATAPAAPADTPEGTTPRAKDDAPDRPAEEISP
ncbi:MAG TPA: hypothetical protein VND94_13680 [Terriglobia bacterium]|nr:hypothetical protein [Terriglobia bacterium]